MTPRRRAEDLRARAAAVTQHATTPAAEQAAPSAGTRAPRSRPVRITVDLAPVSHRRLRRWAEDAAEALGMATVPVVDVVRVLVDMLAEDDDLAARVRASLAARSGQTPPEQG